MQEYRVTVQQEHIETRVIHANNRDEALERAQDGDYDDVVDWHVEGDPCIQEIYKDNKQLKIPYKYQ